MLQKGKLFIQSAWEKKAIVYSLCTWKGRSPSYSVRKLFYSSCIREWKPVCVGEGSSSVHHASERGCLVFTMHQRGGVMCSPCIREGVSCVYHASERGYLVFTMHQRGGVLCLPCIREGWLVFTMHQRGVPCMHHASEGVLYSPCIREGVSCVHHASERGCLVFTIHQRGGVLYLAWVREGSSCVCLELLCWTTVHAS